MGAHTLNTGFTEQNYQVVRNSAIIEHKFFYANMDVNLLYEPMTI